MNHALGAQDALASLSSLAIRHRSEKVVGVRVRHAAYQLHQSADTVTRNLLDYVLTADAPAPQFSSRFLAAAASGKRMLLSAEHQALALAGMKAKSKRVLSAGETSLMAALRKKHAHVLMMDDKEGFSSSTAHLAVRNADVIIIGCEHVTPNGVAAPLGAGLLAELAHARGIPVYALAIGLQYDSEGEECKACGEERVAPDLLTGIISELGVLSHDAFVHDVFHAYPWMANR
jgi:hypothetical protein